MKLSSALQKSNLEKSWIFFLGLAFLFFFFNNPSLAHHPLEGVTKGSLNSLDGLFSGLAHPLIGIDHFLFLVSIGLVGTVWAKRWIPILLLSSCFGTITCLVFGSELPFLETFIGLSLITSGVIAISRLKPEFMLPFFALHGYALGESMVGAEPSPVLAYLFGLIISQMILIVFGIALLRKYSRLNKICIPFLFGVGILLTYGSLFITI